MYPQFLLTPEFSHAIFRDSWDSALVSSKCQQQLSYQEISQMQGNQSAPRMKNDTALRKQVSSEAVTRPLTLKTALPQGVMKAEPLGKRDMLAHEFGIGISQTKALCKNQCTLTKKESADGICTSNGNTPRLCKLPCLLICRSKDFLAHKLYYWSSTGLYTKQPTKFLIT